MERQAPAEPVETDALDRLDFETLITDTSAILMAASAGEVDRSIDVALARVRTFFRADRCGLLAVAPGQESMAVSLASYGEGVPQMGRDINLVRLFPWASRKLLVERQPLVIDRMADLPPEAAMDRATFDRLATRSQFTVPIVTGSLVSHLVVVAAVHEERTWPRHYVPRLRVLGEMMVSALHRNQAFEALATSEERLAHSAAAAGAGLWDLDVPAGTFWVTDEARRIFGIGPDEPATYRRFIAMVHPGERDAVAARIAAVLADGGVFDEHYRIVRDDGSVRWVHATARPSGSTRLIGAAVDATDRVEADSREREQAARVAAALDVAGLGFSYSRVGDGVPYIDPRLGDLFGVDLDDPRAESLWLSRIHSSDRPSVEAVRQRLVEGETESLSVEYRYEHPRRGWIWLRHASRRFEDLTRGVGVHLMDAVQDITDRRRREDELRDALKEIKTLRDQLEQENQYLRREVSGSSGSDLVVGRSHAIRQALGLAEQVAPTTSTVLLVGETGTGKERFASYIHQASPRRARHMVRVNCSAIPRELMESELFGRERGAYTGALSRQAGRFELANGSTIFLDEIGDLPIDVQVKLLRVLQEHTVERLGSPRSIPVDVRVIAATNKNLERAVREGSFRSDLYYRLNVFPILVPALRDRAEDIPTLVDQLVEELGTAMARRFEMVSRASVEALMRYPWPGNVRELRNVLERAMILAPGPVLTVSPPSLASGTPAAASAPATASTPAAAPPSADLQAVEREHILRVLQETGWRIKGQGSASVRLGLKPSTLYFRMKKLGIVRPA